MADGIYRTTIPRRCTWKRADRRCITYLHSSNPGPLCECHERMAQEERNRRRRMRDLAREIELRRDKSQFAAAA